MAKIIIDHDIDAQGNVLGIHFIDTSTVSVQCPQDLVQPVKTVVEYIEYLSANPAVAAAHGWTVMTQLPLMAGKTRWNVLSAWCTANAAGDPHLAGLNIAALTP